MARAYSGREFSLILGIADNDAGSSAGAVGADTQDANAVSGSKVLMRVDSPINDFDFSAGVGTSGAKSDNGIMYLYNFNNSSGWISDEWG